MVNTSSQMIELGTPMPTFALTDTAGVEHRPAQAAEVKGTLVVFMCNHCPFVKHMRNELAALGRECAEQGVAMFGINANDFAKYPDDSPARMKEEVAQAGYTFPYLLDEDQSVAKAFGAACTPDFYLYDGAARLVYRGRLDGSRPGNDVPVSGEDLRAAITAQLEGKGVVAEQKPSIGCNIKWKDGNAPAWFG